MRKAMTTVDTWIRILLVAATLVGLAAPVVGQDDWDEPADLPIEIHGFVEGAVGARIVDDPTQPDDFLVNEARFRLDLAHYRDRAELYFKVDFLSDAVADKADIDVRQAALLLRVSPRLDVRLGRHVLTWGTGDLVFLNDLFPKDFVSFFIGRNDEFLKAPSVSLKSTFYITAANIDVVWTPVFEPDRFITGERLSYFSPAQGGLTSAGLTGPVEPREPERRIENGEFAGRLFRTVAGYELALYGYAGFAKQPRAFDPVANEPTFAKLAVYGASIRGNFAGGVTNVEGAWYDSYKDRDGNDPNLPNSQLRGLVGYERELFANFTTAFQYYIEWVLEHDTLIANSPFAQHEPEEARHVITARLTHQLRQQTLLLSLFAFFSPSDEDGHVRPAVEYKWSDAVTAALGANVMWGDEDTFFGQLEDNTNVYLRARYGF